MSKHTPGPWVASPVYNFSDSLVGYIRTQKEGGGELIAQTRGWVKNSTHDEVTANARLIAAAPKMLKALKSLDMTCANDLVNEAIAAAEEG